MDRDSLYDTKPSRPTILWPVCLSYTSADETVKNAVGLAATAVTISLVYGPERGEGPLDDYMQM